MRLNLNWFLSLSSTICLLVSGCSSAPAAQSGAAAFPPVPVSTAAVASEPVPFEIRAVGTVEPYSTVDVKSQVAGPLVGVKFTEGGSVRKDDPLFEIDPRPYQEALAQAQATLSKDTAQLKQAEANMERDRAQMGNAQLDSNRYAELAKQGIAPRAQGEQTKTTADMAQQSVRADEATADSLRASIQSDQAAIERAKLDLSNCEILAPISGRVGNLLVHAGNLVKANDVPLVVVNQITPIFVSFGVPEQQLGTITQKNANHKLLVKAVPGDASDRVAEGTLTVIDNAVDRNTGTIRLKATFDNQDGTLWPGQFVNVTVLLDTENATVIPSEAVQAGAEGSFVYIVKTDQSVEARPVSVGQTVAGKIVVEKGVHTGETVVIDGQSRLFPGAKIVNAPAEKGK